MPKLVSIVRKSNHTDIEDIYFMTLIRAEIIFDTQSFCEFNSRIAQTLLHAEHESDTQVS
jgi:hypothetical protein